MSSPSLPVPRPTRALALALLLAVTVSGAAASAQPPARPALPPPAADTVPPPAPARSDGGECLGFAFGAWSPPLDAKAAGHAPFPPAASLPHAPGGRDWAATDPVARDTLLLLFPSWWPAGVSIRFAHAPRTPGDTVHGTATALVADGRVRAPEAKVLGWLVPCAAPPAP
ncbi:MAG TPA: hypothetical protein VFS08_11115 [Gemmatimonadaceae bacterium]|nr:hypothetical protein [Gemmatimonadaceae bacterium]